MMKRKENKNDKIKIMLICFLLYAAISWLFMGYSYQSGELVSMGWYRAGLFDLVAVIFSGLTYKINDILYILFVGGMYGVLSQAESYKRIVNKTAGFVKNNSVLAFILITFIVGLYTAISSQIITLFVIVPFIMSVFLKAGHDKITALSASFGGLFIGYLGQIVGTYGNEFIYKYLSVEPSNNVIVKVVLFVVAFVLFNVFGIYHMNNNTEQIEENSDMYEVGEVKKITKKSEQIMTWPTVVVAIMVLVITMIGFIPWIDGFGITLFDKVHTAVMNFSLGSLKLVETLIGTTMNGLGAWTDFLPVIFMSCVLLLVVIFTNRMSWSSVYENFADGVKKIAKVALVYGLAFAFFYLMVAYPWPTAVVDFFIRTDSYNIAFVVFAIIAALIAALFCVDPLYSGYYYGQYLSAIFTVNLGLTAIIWRLGSALALVVAPTSFLLMAALTYADVSYKKWMKYIWKFAVSFFIATVIVLGIVIM